METQAVFLGVLATRSVTTQDLCNQERSASASASSMYITVTSLCDQLSSYALLSLTQFSLIYSFSTSFSSTFSVFCFIKKKINLRFTCSSKFFFFLSFLLVCPFYAFSFLLPLCFLLLLLSSSSSSSSLSLFFVYSMVFSSLSHTKRLANISLRLSVFFSLSCLFSGIIHLHARSLMYIQSWHE